MIGQICVFYPMLNVAAVPVLTITLRNNIMQVVPIKRWIRNSGMCLFLLEVSTLTLTPLRTTDAWSRVYGRSSSRFP